MRNRIVFIIKVELGGSLLFICSRILNVSDLTASVVHDDWRMHDSLELDQPAFDMHFVGVGLDSIMNDYCLVKCTYL